MIRWSVFFVFLFVYRSLYSVAGQLIVTRFTSLGDAGRYQKEFFTIGEVGTPIVGIDYSITLVGTALTESLGAIFFLMSGGNRLLINFGFQAIAFIGIYKFLMSTPPEVRRRLAILVMLPSFTLWSSVASKESLLVFSIGIICAYIVDMYYNKENLSIVTVVSLLVLFLIKPQLTPVVIFVIFVTKVGRYVKEKALFAISAGLLSLAPLYLFRDRIDAIAFEIPRHFLGTFGSTREVFWVEKYDVFLKAPYGMFQGFIGPTLSEAATGHLLHVLSLAESLVLVGFLIVLLVRRLPQIPVYNFFVGLFVIFWAVFPYYPIQIMNPGSAVRYRTGYILLVFMAFAVFFSRDLYKSWIRPRQQEMRSPIIQQPVR